jgi:hypothetical protein
MIAIGGNENIITIGQATRLVPSRTGKRLHISTIHRWIAVGVRGVRLESIMVGGVRMTSVEALQRFSDRLSGNPRPDAVPAPASNGHQRAEAVLKSKGFDD